MSKAMRELLEISLPGRKTLWFWLIMEARIGFNLFAMVLVMILRVILHRDRYIVFRTVGVFLLWGLSRCGCY